jgi:hypothetical protein
MPLTHYPGADELEAMPVQDPAEAAAQWRRAMAIPMEAVKEETKPWTIKMNSLNACAPK